MSGNLRLAFILLAVVFAGFVAVKVTAIAIKLILSLVIPVLAIVVVAGVLYVVVNRKALGGGNRRILP